MKVVINKCYGGFSLSPQALKEFAKRKGRKCYFFRHEYKRVGRRTEEQYVPVDKPKNSLALIAFDIPNPQKILNGKEPRSSRTKKETADCNDLFSKHYISQTLSPEDRADKDLVAVVEKLGEKANGSCADLKVVEIPDGVSYSIEEYDGQEWIAETHRTWG